MKHIRLFEEFERGGIRGLSPKELIMVNSYISSNHPYLNDDITYKIAIRDGYYIYNEEEFESFESVVDIHVEYLLEYLNIGIYQIHKGLIDVDDNVDMRDKNISRIPFLFGEVAGNFLCNINSINTLYGSPQKVGGDFWCSDNKLETLKWAPKEVGGGVYCSNNVLTTLEGAPQDVAYFHCEHNKLKTLEGGPQDVTLEYDCSFNELVTLKGAPKKVGTSFWCDSNKLTDLIFAIMLFLSSWFD
jgi:hypothetical protein